MLPVSKGRSVCLLSGLIPLSACLLHGLLYLSKGVSVDLAKRWLSVCSHMLGEMMLGPGRRPCWSHGGHAAGSQLACVAPPPFCLTMGSGNLTKVGQGTEAASPCLGSRMSRNPDQGPPSPGSSGSGPAIWQEELGGAGRRLWSGPQGLRGVEIARQVPGGSKAESA